MSASLLCFFFFFNDTATTEIYTLSLHDALPILRPTCHGLRGNEPGPQAFPRSSRQTDMPASARRWVVTDPPKPEPTTTASKCASGSDGGRSWLTASLDSETRRRRCPGGLDPRPTSS